MIVQQGDRINPLLERFQRTSLWVGIAGLSASALIALLGFLLRANVAEQFFQAYLYAFLFWLGLALGCLMLLMLQHLAGGPWGAMIRRPLEAGAMVLPVMGLLFIPLLFGIGSLYEWSHADVVAASPVLQAKTAYLNVPFFIIRALIYFSVWIGAALWFFKGSQKQDAGDQAITQTLRNRSAPGIILYIITMTFAAFDWGMSLDPEWFSGMYGVIFMIGQVISAVAFIIIFMVLMGEHKPLTEALNAKRLQDLGNLLMAFTMFWAYVSISQFIIIWSGNLPETNTWYVLRLNTPWRGLSAFLMAFHFFAPFVVLFSRWVKQKGKALIWVALWMLLMRLVDLFWIMVPSFGRQGLQLHFLDVALLIGMGGIWLYVFMLRIRGLPLLPLHDPRLGEVSHG